jgi:membrane-bound ClpP family serine protease
VRAASADGVKVFVHGETWDAISDAAVEPGARIEVVRVESGMRLRVRPVPAARA